MSPARRTTPRRARRILPSALLLRLSRRRRLHSAARRVRGLRAAAIAI